MILERAGSSPSPVDAQPALLLRCAHSAPSKPTGSSPWASVGVSSVVVHAWQHVVKAMYHDAL